LDRTDEILERSTHRWVVIDDEDDRCHIAHDDLPTPCAGSTPKQIASSTAKEGISADNPRVWRIAVEKKGSLMEADRTSDE